jgi:large subunit ribosomal protein L25
MKSITIKGSERSVGKVATKALRNAGEVPCVLYGGSASTFFSRKKAFKTWFTLQTLTVVIDLGDGKSFTAILKTFRFTCNR